MKYKNRGFWEILERIRAFYANRDGYWYIWLVFRELNSENQPLEEDTLNSIQNNHTYLSCTRTLYKEIKLYKEINSYSSRVYWNCLYKIVMNKTKAEVCREVLRETFLKTLKEQKTLSNSEQNKYVIERKHLLKR